MEEYVSCKINKTSEKSMVMYQDTLIKKMLKKNGNELGNMRKYESPASTGFAVVRPVEGEPILSEEMQTRYRSGIGILMFLIKYSRPDISNAVRELSKVNDGATEGQYKELLRIMKYVKDTKASGLKYHVHNKELSENCIWEMVAYCDSDFAGDKDSQKSVTGYGIYLLGCLVASKSRGQKTVPLSSSEAEYLAIADVCIKILFVRNVLDFLGVRINYPILVRCDNVGAIFLSYNAKTSPRTKHVDIKAHFV